MTHMDYGDFQHLTFSSGDDGVLVITIDRPERLNAANDRLHHELGAVWGVVGSDPSVRCAVITGAGRAFSAGGDLDMVERQLGDPAIIARVHREAADLVYGMIACPTPIVSAINGVAVGAGLAVALMADISIIAEGARLSDGHIRLGVGAGDHAAIIWPLLCGMAKTKYYLLTADFISGPEAERIGLVSRCVPDEQVLPEALALASRLAAGPQRAIRSTKHVLNGWLRNASPIFDAGLAHEMLDFFGDDAREGLVALKEKRAPQFGGATRPSSG